jgi:hypothetical protein
VNPYLDLTAEFNAGGLRAIVSSGQAVVVHGLSMTSKDGDWIVREQPDVLAHILAVLGRHGARYRYGAPLDVRWMRGAWSAHLEFLHDGLRLRTDFVTRPPRLSQHELDALWAEQTGLKTPCVDLRRLVALKRTSRERDYVVIGEIARRLAEPADRLLALRSADDLVGEARAQRDLAERLAEKRPLLRHALRGDVAPLREALDAERRGQIDADTARLARYTAAMQAWAARWPALERNLRELDLAGQHRLIVAAAEESLPMSPPGVAP